MKIKVLLFLLMVSLFAACGSLPVREKGDVDPKIRKLVSPSGKELFFRTYFPSNANKTLPPLLLLPDLFESPMAYDLGEISMAKAFAGAGYNVYVYDWISPGSKAIPDFDHIAKESLPAAFFAVKENSSGKNPILIGHGLGGAAALVFAGTQKEADRPAAVITLGSCSRFIIDHRVGKWLADKEKELKGEGRIIISRGANIKPPFLKSHESVLDVLLANDKNLDRAIKEKYYSTGLAPVSRKLARQVLGWIKTGRTMSLDGKTNYSYVISKVECPALFLAGRIDNVVDPYETILTFNSIKSRKKEIRIFSRVNFYKSNYGHVGLLIGPNAKEEVFPYIHKWIISLD